MDARQERGKGTWSGMWRKNDRNVVFDIPCNLEVSLQLGLHQRRMCAENEQRERGRCGGRVTIVKTCGGPSWKSYRRILLHGRIESSLFSRLYSKSWPTCPTHALRVYTSHVCERFYEYDHEHEHALRVSIILFVFILTSE